MRPKSLAEVARLALEDNSFELWFANFLDEFYLAPSAEALAENPPLLAPTMGEPGQIRDAYLAGAAEELAHNYNLTYPRWADADERKLHKPWFASSLASLRVVLILESPAGFRSRNLFVSENALTRA